MRTFTLSQVRESADVYIYPDGDLSSCTELTAYGINPNYACVDEETTDEDDTYVFGNTPSTVFDLYTLPNQSLSGVINYIQVFTRAKSAELAQHENGIYKIICSPDSVCTHVYKSIDINLTTGYSTYSNVWTENPSTVTPWIWADINAMSIGEECSSPTITGAAIELTVRPNAAGDLSEQHVLDAACPGAGNHYMCIDDVEADWFDTALFASSNFPYTADNTDLYHIPNHTTETGNITSVKIFAWVTTNYDYFNNWARTDIKTYATEFEGNTEYLTDDVWQLISTTYTKNPFTDAAWTWLEFDNLQIGTRLHAGQATVYCTQVYAVVTYTPTGENPEIRTTQCYVKVNYELPAVECTLNKPSKISYDHNRSVKMLNFWDGSREVYDLSRNSKSVVMMGEEFFEPSVCSVGCPCERIQCVRCMGLNGSTVDISGFTGIRTLTNGDYKIRSFGWKKISDNPIHYSWILELENTVL